MSAFDAIEIGRRDALGAYRFDSAEADAFARQFDPLALASSDDGAPLVSPWHVAAAFMPLNVAFQAKAGVLQFGPSPGVSDLVWHRPVLQGETLHYSQSATAKRRTARLAGWGLLTTHVEARDDADALVFSMTGRVLVRTD